MTNAIITSTQSKFYFGTLTEKANYGSYTDGTHHTNIGPCIVEVRRVTYAQHSPSYYVYIDGLHQCGGLDRDGWTHDSIAASLTVAGRLVAIEEPQPEVFVPTPGQVFLGNEPEFLALLAEEEAIENRTRRPGPAPVYCPSSHAHYVYGPTSRSLVCDSCAATFTEVPGEIGPGHIPLHQPEVRP